MNDFVFKIFGAPHTFDLYEGSESEITYFQNFDNGGKENVKFTIHRTVSGKISYSYLRYNFISSSGRPNSFFGMSVIFDKEYCEDTMELFDVFDDLYNNVILKKGILLTELKGNTTAQAKYLVQKYDEAEVEIKSIENNFIRYLKSHFAELVKPINSSFEESNSMIKMKYNEDNGKFNADIVSSLRNYSWVHISPEYKEEKTGPSDEFLGKLSGTIKKVKEATLDIHEKKVPADNIQKVVNNWLAITNGLLREIHSLLERIYIKQKGEDINLYLQKQPILQKHYNELLERQERLEALLKDTRKITTPQPGKITAQRPRTGNKPFGGAAQQTAAQQTAEQQTAAQQTAEQQTAAQQTAAQQTAAQQTAEQQTAEPNNVSKHSPTILSYWKNNKLKISVVVSILIIVITCIIIFWPDSPPKKEAETTKTEDKTKNHENSADELTELGNQALSNNDFDAAIDSFEKAGKTDLVNNAKSKAVAHWYEQAKNASDLDKRKEYLKNAKKYGGYPSTDGDIAGVEKQIDQHIKDSIAANRRSTRPNPPTTPQQQATPSCTKVTISKSDSRKIYSKDDKFYVTANSLGTTIPCTGGEWRYEPGLYADKSQNPTQVQIVSVPDNGIAMLRYYVGNDQKAAITIKISQ